jgi:glycine betaine/proline transport system substrate-binding protein
MNRVLNLKATLILIALLLTIVAVVACGNNGSEDGDKPTIVFSDLNWTSAQVQNRIAQFIVEHGYGYDTDAILGGTLPNFQGLLKGDIHVDMEVWLPNQRDTFDPAVANGQVVPIGKSLGEDWQSSFVIPKYLADQHPGLKSVEDLKKDEFKKLFETTDSHGKARLVSCVVGWSCETVNSAQIEAYNLLDHVHVVNPGSQDAMFADLQGNYDNQEPWLGYMWGTGDPALTLDLVRLEEPAYSDECWFTTKACGYKDATIMIAVHPSLTSDAPDVVAFLRNWGFNIEEYKKVAKHSAANPGIESKDAAAWYLENNEDIWSSWVPAKVAKKVKAALTQIHD